MHTELQPEMPAKARRRTGRKRDWTPESVFAKLVRLCNVRERSTSELLDRLRRDGIPDAMATAAVERASDCGLIDDLRFAEAYLRGKLALGWGQQRIERELERFGVNASMLEQSLEGYPQDYFSEQSELNRALAELTRFRSRARNIQDARYRRLLHKGYASDTIKAAIESYGEGTAESD